MPGETQPGPDGRAEAEGQPLLASGSIQQGSDGERPAPRGATSSAAPPARGAGRHGYAPLALGDDEDAGGPAPPPAAPATAPAAAQPAGAALKSAASGDVPVCRICLEEDDASSLVAPCRCTGTQRWVHPRCVQRWADEKRSARCEICGATYSDSIVAAPPPPPPSRGGGADLSAGLSPDEAAALNQLFARIIARGDAEGGGAVAAAAARRRLRLLEVYDVNHDGDYYDSYDRQSTVSWSATLATFLLFLLLLHSSVDGGAGSSGVEGGAGGPGGAGLGPDGPGGAPGSGSGDDAGPMGTGLAVGLALFGVWVLAKLFMIAIPLLALSRAWHNSQDSDDEEEAAAPARGGAAGGDVEEGARGGLELQHVAGAGAGGARQHPFLLAMRALQQQQWRAAPAPAPTAGGEGEGAGAGALGGARLVAIV